MPISRLLPASFEQPNPKNLIINGDMSVCQRSSSSTGTGYQTVDRFKMGTSGVDNDPTQAQVDVASGTTPYNLGFRKAFKVTNANQSSGAGASDIIHIQYLIEAQDIANSGWNYTSSSSFITLSFWVKSSVAQNFFGHILTKDGTVYNYPFSTGSLSANTWTKVTKTISGNSNLQINNDNGSGLEIRWSGFLGTDKTASVSENAWVAYDNTQRTPDNTSTWYTTNNATFEITGVCLNEGSHAISFPHESFAENLAKCQRYFCRTYTYGVATGTASVLGAVVTQAEVASTAYSGSGTWEYPVEMRAAPTVTLYSTQNADTTGKTTADGTDGTGTTYGIGSRSVFICRHNDSSGVVLNAFLKAHAVATAEL